MSSVELTYFPHSFPLHGVTHLDRWQREAGKVVSVCYVKRVTRTAKTCSCHPGNRLVRGTS